MKKTFITLAALVLSLNAGFAQEVEVDALILTTKQGKRILPEAGDWGLGISANPFFNYFGNFFNSSTANTAPTFNYFNNGGALFGKYVVNENTFYRGRFNVSLNQNVDKGLVIQSATGPQAEDIFVEDVRRRNSTAVMLAFGIEKRKGSGRIQGLYGAELITGYSSNSVSYEYGNAITQTFNDPETYDFGSNVGGNQRVLEVDFAGTFNIGARGFVGVEYFIAPKLSLGGEFGYQVDFSTRGKDEITRERWNNNGVQETTIEGYSSELNVTSFGIGLDNLNGNINLMFYF